MFSEDEVVRVQSETQKWRSAFDNWTARIRYDYASPLRLTLRALQTQRARRGGLKILDCGFGHGNALFSFGVQHELHGIDLSPHAVQLAEEKARRLGYRRFCFKVPPADNSLALDYADNFFDVIICSHTIEHVHEDLRLLREFHRIVRPNGVAIVVAPLDAHDRNGVLGASERLNPGFGKDGSYHVWLYNIETLVSLAEESRFEVESAEEADAIYEVRLRLPRFLQVLSSVLLCTSPYIVWKLFDSFAKQHGYNPRQAVLVLKKSS